MKDLIQEKIAIPQKTLPSKALDYSHVDDDSLLSLIKDRDDERAFAEIMARYKDKVKGLSFRLLYNSEMAEDAMQDVFCTVWRTRDKWQVAGAAQFSTWIYRVTVNRCVDLKRRLRPQVDIHDMELAHDDNADELIQARQLSDALQALLADLPGNQALALKLYYLEEQSIADIAFSMGKSELSIRSMIKRGKASLRDQKGALGVL